MKLTYRLDRLERIANPPAKHIVLMQDYDNPDLFTSLDTQTKKNRYDLTKEQARAMIRPGDSVTWLLAHENAIVFEGPDAKQKEANFGRDRNDENESG